jgi:predicted nucleotidyltransferase
MLTEQQKNIIIETLKPYNPSFIGLFGSYARDEETEKSDIDILYEFQDPEYSLFDIIDLKELLHLKLNIPVDLVSKNFMNRHIKPFIERDLKVLYNA